MRQVIHMTVLHDRQQEDPRFSCRQCGGELFSGEVYYDICEHPVCRDCLAVFARRYFRGCRRQVPSVGVAR